MVVGSLYSLVRLLVNAIATSRQDQAQLQAEVLVLRRQVQVLERQIKRVKWTPADRMVLAALWGEIATVCLGGFAGSA